MRNAESYVVQTLDSLLVEKDVDIEVIVINDNSTDQSLARVLSVRDDRIHIIDGPGLGISACLNVGLAASRGDILMRCDADDLYPAGRLRNQVAWLDANPEYGAVCGGFSTMDIDGRLIAELGTGTKIANITEELKAGVTRTTLCSYAMRRSVIQIVGGFRPYFETAEDIDFQLRLGEVANVMYLPQIHYCYRLHDSSITHTQANSRRVFFDNTARTFLEQRRVSGQDDLQRGNPPKPSTDHLDPPGAVGKQIQGMLIGAAWNEHGVGNRLNAIIIGCRALKYDPCNVGVWRSLLALVLKPQKK